jgi:hypothetical protein
MSDTAIEEFAARVTAPSWARTADWQAVPAQLRRRAFWSAAVTDARALSEEREAVDMLLKRASKGGKIFRRDTAITEIQAIMRERGLDTGRPDALTNPAAEERIKLVIDTNRAQAQGYARFKRSSTGGALLAFPAQELVRVRASDQERDWSARFIAAGGKLTNGRMIALKTDPIWISRALNRFGTPYTPFDFGSGMGLRDISRREAVSLGLIAADWRPDSDLVGDFNAQAEADVSRVSPAMLDSLKQLFGDAVEFADGKARFAPR